MDAVSDFGSRLRERRIEKGWTQEQLAQKVDATKSSIHDYEAGTKYPQVERLIKIIVALDASADQLLGLKEQVVLNTEGLTSSQKALIVRTAESMRDEFKKANKQHD